MVQISLKWETHNSSTLNLVDHLKTVGSFVDVTLICEGQIIQAHQLMLSAGSNVLRKTLLSNPAKHPIVIMQDMKYATLTAVMDFLYKGEISVLENELETLLKAANALEVNALVQICKERLKNKKVDSLQTATSSRRFSARRKRCRRSSLDSGSDISIDSVELQRDISVSSSNSEHDAFAMQTDILPSVVSTKPVEFCPQITDTRTLNETCSEEKSNKAPVLFEPLNTSPLIQDARKKDVSTQYDIQILEKLESNLTSEENKTVPCPKAKCHEESGESATDSKKAMMSCPRTCIEVTSGRNMKRSIIWKYFTPLNMNYAACRICRNKFSFRTSITNLTKHIQKRHPGFNPKRPPKLPEVPVLNLQDQEIEEFEDIDIEPGDVDDETALLSE